MADTNIDYDRSNQKCQEITAVLNAYRKVIHDGPNMIDMLLHMIDGDGTCKHRSENVAIVGVKT